MSAPSPTPERPRARQSAGRPLARLRAGGRSDERLVECRRARGVRVRRRQAGLAIGVGVVVAGFVVSLAGDSEDRGIERTVARPEPPSPPVAPPPALPGPDRFADAAAYARARTGNASLAVVDTRGVTRGLDARRTYVSASVLKAMVLVAYLDRTARSGRSLTPQARSQLEGMIRRSENPPVPQLLAEVGTSGLSEVAARARMRGFMPLLAPWGLSRITAEDQARFFLEIDDLVPPSYRRYARSLLTTIVPEQSWGVPEAARGRFTILFKGGWLPSDERRWSVHQVAKLESGRGPLSIAVLSDGNPSRAYGIETVRGVAKRLLR